MAHRIEIKGPFSYVLLGLVTVFSAGNWLAPGLVAGLTGKVNAIGACCAAVIERYHRNLSGHWITAEKGI
jgi:hypothetical protein